MQGKQFDLPKDLLESLTDSLSDEQIADRYKVTPSTIYQLRLRLGVASRYAKTSCRTNRKTGAVLSPGEGVASSSSADLKADYFDEIDTEHKAYFLGLIIADGHVNDGVKNCFMGIELQFPDCEVLPTLLEELNCKKQMEKLSREGKKESGRIKVYSRHLVKALQSKGKSSTETVTVFAGIPANLRRHFVRGVMDGDGHIDHKKKGLYLGSCSLALCEGVAKWVREGVHNPTTRLTRRTLPSGKIFYRLNFTLADPVVRWIYEDCTIAIPRKKEQAAIWLSRSSAGALVSPLLPVLGSGVSR